MTAIADQIRAFADEHHLDDPRDIADKILPALPADVRDHIIRAGVAAYIRTTLNASRHDAITNALPARGRSAKVSTVRDWWARMCDSRVSVADGWKRIGDCTIDDLAYCAGERRTEAARVIAHAERYERLAAMLTEHGVHTVRELPADAAASLVEAVAS